MQTTHEPYLFCRTPDCDVVYYSADGEQTFATGQIRERVYQKEPGAEDAPVCYCFGHSRGSIRAEIEQHRPQHRGGRDHRGHAGRLLRLRHPQPAGFVLPG